MHSIFRVKMEFVVNDIWLKIKLGQRNQVLNVKYLIEIEIVDALLLPCNCNQQRNIELMKFGVRYVTIPMSTETAMKRKKHHTEKSRIIGLLVASFLRGRLLHRTLIIAISACLLLLFALFSLFAPSTLNKINLQTTQNNDQVRSRFQDSVFQVPVSY